ncbi:MAG: branched-chain amino acid transport system II carrier protein [Peptoniphilaceae bacterium]|nr:branched-chain amino acid transport system II carrier protein [Peptoniphilaceae bacterium]MDY3738634.1 branched-chain amino acid transport system II carrier protein [Peptoniphilaceae bacterium]
MDTLVIGFALFSMFFGAGNLIFPPTLGFTYKSDFLIAAISFCITGVGLTLLAVLAVAKKKGDIFSFSKLSGNLLGKILTILVILCIGPVFAIPRTSATTYEVISAADFSVNKYLFAFLFFALTLYFSIVQGRVIDIIGKFLTPLLLITLFTLIVKSVITPISPIPNFQGDGVVNNSLLEGYNTMDAIAALVFTPTIAKSVIAKGHTEEKDYMKTLIGSAIIAMIGLSVIYIALSYIGATSSSLGKDLSRVDLLVLASSKLLGNTGKLVLSLAMALACLTTSIGLVSSVSEIFSNMTDKKIGYKPFVVLICIISALISIFGVETIVQLAIPILGFIYPIVIVFIFFTFFENVIKSKKIIVATTAVTVFFTLIESINNMAVTVENVFGIENLQISKFTNFLNDFLNFFPLYKLGFIWLIPAVIVFIISIIVFKKER